MGPVDKPVMIDLRERDRQKILEIIQQSFSEPIEVWAYGSRVNGTNHEASDLDLVLRSQTLAPLNEEEVRNFNERLKESTIPILIEARDWAVIPESFRRQIIRNYAVLYSGPQQMISCHE